MAERSWHIIRQWFGLAKSKSWGSTAALETVLAVVARAIQGTANVIRVAALQEDVEGLSHEERLQERRKVFGLVLERTARRKPSPAPRGDPPWRAVILPLVSA